jgi:transposase-like protein
MGKNTRRRYSRGLKEQVILRMQEGERVKALSHELLIPPSVLFTWRQQAEDRPGGKKYEAEKAKKAGETAALEARVRELEGALGRKTMELDFFQGALRRLAASGRLGNPAGGTPSGPKSAAGWNRKAD